MKILLILKEFGVDTDDQICLIQKIKTQIQKIC